MSTTATTTKVWFKLFLGRKELKPFKVTLNQNDDIADLMEAVKSTCENSLQGVSSAQLRMYPPGTKVPISEEDDDASLDPGDLVDDLNGGSSSKDAFVIVAPDIDQRRANCQKLKYDWNIDFLSAELEKKLSAYFDQLKKEQKKRSVQNTIHVYKIYPNEQNPHLPLCAFSPTDCYWREHHYSENFEDCDTRGILYRPKIVKEMMNVVDETFKKKHRTGIMIKGPHGIGKSHSLVNLVCTLQYDSNCKYLVTFIPDCQEWKGVFDLYTAICNSFGTSFSDLTWQMGSDVDEQLELLNTFVDAIDLILQRMDRRWVLVFDHINRLFIRPVLNGANDLGSLPFPFSAINNIFIKGGRIVTIIAASTDNEVDYKDSHPGFEEYNHSPLQHGFERNKARLCGIGYPQ